MSTTLEPVRPIELSEIREARERIAGTIVRTPLVRLELGAGLPRYSAQAREPPADQRLQAARRRQRRGHAARVRAQARRLDDQRGQRRTGRRLRGEKSRRALHASSRSRPRRPRSSSECRRSARNSFRCRTMSPGRRSTSVRFPESKGRSCIRSTITISSPVMRTMGLEILEDAPDTAAVIAGIGGGGLITGVGSAIKALKPGDQGLGRRTGDGRARGALVRDGISAGVQGLEAFVRRRRRRPERFPAHVGADEAGGGRLHRRHPGGDEERDAADGGKGANHFRRRGRSAARRRADRESRPGPDRRDRFRRKY